MRSVALIISPINRYKIDSDKYNLFIKRYDSEIYKNNISNQIIDEKINTLFRELGIDFTIDNEIGPATDYYDSVDIFTTNVL